MENKDKKREEIKKKIQAMSEDELVDLYLKADWLSEQLTLLKKLRFGAKSERIVSGQLNLFNEIEEIQDHPDPQEEAEEEAQPQTKKRKKSREANFSALPTKIIDHGLEDPHCEICGTRMRELAPQIIDVLQYQPARYTVERHVVHQYVCPACSDENLESEVIAAPGAPKRLISGSKVSPSVVAGITFNKYVSGTPLYRQEQELKRKKVEISRATMSNWLMCCAQKLSPLYEQMLSDLEKQSHIHMDETTLTVLEDKAQGERQKSYMWVGVSGKWEAKPLAVYYYNESRAEAVAKEILPAEYAGSLHCDGYHVYPHFEKATILGCFAHCRRYFVEALEVSPLHKQAKKLKGKALEDFCEQHPGYGQLLHVVDKIRKLFVCEENYVKQGLNPEQIKEKRQKEQRPIAEKLFTEIEKLRSEYSEKSKAGVAIRYAINQKAVLLNYLEDGKAEISNNRAERMVKPFVMGRKAWLFSKTKSGARMSSIYYSLVESAKLNRLDIHLYLEYVLTQIQEHPDSFDVQALLPYSDQLPDFIRIR